VLIAGGTRSGKTTFANAVCVHTINSSKTGNRSVHGARPPAARAPFLPYRRLMPPPPTPWTVDEAQTALGEITHQLVALVDTLDAIHGGLVPLRKLV